MILIVFFSDVGTPKTGLSPVIDIWEDDGVQLVTAAAMTEIGGGFYKYDFTTYDETKNYCFRADGTSTLTPNDRYTYNTNEIGQVTEDLTFLQDIEGGKWQIIGNQMIFYKSDNTTEVARFNLFDSDGNPTMINVFDRQRV